MKTNLHHLLTEPIRSPSAHRAARRYGSMRGSLTGALCILLAEIMFAQNSWSITNPDMFKLYAHTLIVDYKEFKCLEQLWTKESNFNPRAHNGSHWGICQGRSDYMRRANYKQQVHWCIKYSYNRYGSIAMALEHWRKHGWH